MSVVIPTTVKLKAFVTGSSDNFDISGKGEIHGTILTITAHLTDDNRVVDPKTLSLEIIPKGTETKLHEQFANVPYVEDRSKFYFPIKILAGGKNLPLFNQG